MSDHGCASPIAIVGASGRYAGASDLAGYWANLSAGRHSIQEIPPHRWDVNKYYEAGPRKPGKIYCKALGLLEGAECFDPLFFSISPSEAETIDPQQRLFLQEAYHAFEDAAYDVRALSNARCGVYLGIMHNEYAALTNGRGGSNSPTAHSFSIAAARIAYHLNLKGPAIAVDTACSSSLVATHLACQALRNEEIDLALAGGVTLYLSPQSYLGMCAAGMLSPEGLCKTFDRSASGFVPGEGVGAIVLKRLSDAQRDRDLIYGVIVASALNQDGKTNGITAPNVTSQIQLMRDLYARHDISPESISYVEAHGTATPLGDPIELQALSSVFREWTQKQRFCAIGSVKSNIGHTSAAAGVASIHKVLLQLRHGMLAPSLHFQTPTPHFDLESSPFFVNTSLRPWQTPDGTPRLSAISSFGMSGTNAHLLLQEYVPEPAPQLPANAPIVIVLSAKTRDALRQRARQIHELAGQLEATREELLRLAYTLQVGRECLEERLAFVAESAADVRQQLQRYLDGKPDPSLLHAGRAERRNREMLSLFSEKEVDASIAKLMREGEIGRLLPLWVKGLTLDWRALYADATPAPMRVPGYPFAKEHLWIAAADGASQAPIEVAGPAGGHRLHPLVHRNTSDFAGQRYSSVFAGDEFFLRDHVLHGVRLLPAVASLEMARAAVHEALSRLPQQDEYALCLKQVAWLRPMAAGDAATGVEIVIQPSGPNEFDYVIRSAREDAAAAATPGDDEADVGIYSRGVLELAVSAPAPRVPLDNLRQQCGERVIAHDECYELLKGVGIEYGPAMRALQAIHVGTDELQRTCVLAHITLPPVVQSTHSSYVLHPSVLDAALQASLGLSFGSTERMRAVDRVVIPYALDRIEIFASLPSEAFAHIRQTRQLNGGTLELDVDVCDPQGRVCVRIQGLTMIAAGKTASDSATLLYKPVWKREPAPDFIASAAAKVPSRHIFILGAAAGIRPELQVDGVQSCQLLRHPEPDATIEQQYLHYTAVLSSAIQEIIGARPYSETLVQVLVADDAEWPVWLGLAGLLKTVSLETPGCITQLLVVEHGQSAAQWMRQLDENARCESPCVVRYRREERYVWQLEEVEPAEHASPASVFRNGGVYLITGGAGGLGQLMADQIARSVSDATVILTGRSRLDGDRQRALTQGRGNGCRIEYHCVDVTDRAALRALVENVSARCGGLNGVIHSAGLLHDSLFVTKTRQQFDAVLAPKVLGASYLDWATRDQPLDFFVLFSSVASVFGNVGQADYAVANAYMDGLAHARAELVAASERSGRTLSVCWPFWANGGMQLDDRVLRQMQRSTGATPLSTRAGLVAFDLALAANVAQVVVLSGDPVTLRAAVARATVRVERRAATGSSGSAEPSVPAATLVMGLTKALLAETLKIPSERIDADAPFESLGVDSITVVQLTRSLEASFGPLSKTLLFEHRNLQSLSEYLVANHGEQVRALLPGESQAAAGTAAPDGRTVQQSIASLRARRPELHAAGTTAVSAPAASVDDIAIIGVAGCYPGAGNLDEYWHVLSAGVDCITEIPAERWDYRAHYDERRGVPGKSYCKWGGFLAGVDQFDPLFFNISPAEAERMDPQERIFLQCAYAAIQDAGYTRERLGKSGERSADVGVFVGVMYEEYQLFGAHAQALGEPLSMVGSPASIANRVSYFCNFHGPSMAVDTMCSSSLTAIHLACQSLRAGDCGVAIAGGVNVSVHPNKYLALAQGHFCSSKGRCESFGAGGDGYVPGEGVGAIVLKRLSQAIADGDQIHAVIKATSVNHGGKTNGYSVPDPRAQAQVIARALQQSRVPPRAISYVEAHGTGTSLGDPIEIGGLTQAFKQFTSDLQFCAIGSAKSNIGHCESAAGIAGITKVLLQMKHELLVRSLHCEVTNPNIDFASTPFVVQQRNAPWRRPTLLVNGRPQEYPRVAGISSFGAGGSNAHVILQEHVASQRAQAEAGSQLPAVVVLSAKSALRLREQVEQLLQAIDNGTLPPERLPDAAYTLQVGREAMDVRLGCVVGSVAELRSKLESFLRGDDSIANLYTADIRHSKDAVALFAADEDLQLAVEAWVAKGKHGKLVDLWVKGLAFDWRQLHAAATPRRMSLPTYPFARERYWVTVPTSASSVPGLAPPSWLHPLVQRNTSDLREQKFTSRFTGTEFFLRDHRVQGQRVLPGVAQLELVRAAVKLSLPESQPGWEIQLENVMFVRPVVVGEAGSSVHIRLVPQADGAVDFEIYGEGAAHEEALYSRGSAMAVRPQLLPVLDLDELRRQCTDFEVSGAQCYESFARGGLEYGATLRALQRVCSGRDRDGRRVALAELKLPAAASGSRHEYVLHPSLMDGGLQGTVGMALGTVAHEQPLPLPFAVERVQWLAPLQENSWAVIHQGEGSGAPGALDKLDIDITDDSGLVCVRVVGFSSRSSRQAERPDAHVGELTLLPVWNAVSHSANEVWPASQQRVLILGSGERARELGQLHAHSRCIDPSAAAGSEEIAALLRDFDPEHIFWLLPEQSHVDSLGPGSIAAQSEGVLLGFALVKALLSLDYATKALGLSVVTVQTQALATPDQILPAHASVHGLVGALAKEYPQWRVRSVDVPVGQEWSVRQLLNVPADANVTNVLRNGQWFQPRLLRCALPDPETSAFRRGGVYVILGGAGGIGELFTEYLIEQYAAQVIWIGRRAADNRIRDQQQRLSALGPKPHYIAADATDRAALAVAYQDIKEQVGTVNGIVHAAIVLRDQSLARMTEQAFAESVAAKVDTAVNVANVFGNEALDFVLVFSSLQSFARPAGQSNYAAGCTFIDSYAGALRRQWPVVKVVNWGYWGDAGVVAFEHYRQRMSQLGIGSIEPTRAMLLVERLLVSPCDQVAYLNITAERVAADLGVADSEAILIGRPAASSNEPLQLPAARSQRALPERNDRHDIFQTLLAKLLWVTLQELRACGVGPFDAREWQKQAGVAPTYERWLQQGFTLLVEQGHLTREGDLLTVVDAALLDSERCSEQWQELKSQTLDDPRQHAQVMLVDALLPALPRILQGHELASAVMFPEGSLALVSGVYERNPVADHANDVMAEALLAYLRSRATQPAAGFRLLEIGAGTGATSAALLERLGEFAGAIREYCYTDISKAFLSQGTQRFAQSVPYLTTKLFDVERPVGPQGLEVGAYDVVIAANVLHATSDMRRTVRNAKALLKAGGVLLINELVDSNLFLHLTFGLLPGWWLYQDPELRVPGGPALSPRSWQALLQSERFPIVLQLDEASHAFGQQLILAQSDGVIRQASGAVSSARSAPAAAIGQRELRAVAGHGDAQPTGGQLRDQVQAALIRLVSELLKIPLHDVDPGVAVTEFGFDSITLTGFAGELRKRYGLALSPAVFFEHPRLSGLASFLVREHEAVLANHFATAEANGSENVRETAATAGASGGVKRFWPAPAQSASREIAGHAAPGKEPIAIIGMSGRYPRAEGLDEYWDNLRSGRDCITEIPPHRWPVEGFHAPDRNTALRAGQSYCKLGGFVESFARFDLDFFGIPAAEASATDPQELVLLEAVWTLLENAGYARETFDDNDRVGVYVGAMPSVSRQRFPVATASAPVVASLASLAHRISRFFDFNGPSVAFDTQSSSSLTAIHFACQALRSGEAEVAVAAGVSWLSPELYVSLCQMGLLSERRDSRSFTDGDGVLVAEGVGAVLLKPLSRAVADGDHIHALIRSTGITHSGQTHGGYTPSPREQERLFAEVIASAGIDARTITYVDASANGSPMGDPVEVFALTRAFQRFTDEKSFCALGSVKSNIGHAVASSGLSQLTKVVLQMKHRQLTPLVNLSSINPAISLAGSPFYLSSQLQPWQQAAVTEAGRTGPVERRAMVNSIGNSGAYASLILEEYVSPESRGESRSTHPSELVIVSAADRQRLREKAAQLIEFLDSSPAISLRDLAYTLQVGRASLRSRLAVVVSSCEQLIRELRTYVDGAGDEQIATVLVGESTQDPISSEPSDAEEQQLRQYLSQRDLQQLARVWVDGRKVSWHSWYPPGVARRLQLPTHPFARRDASAVSAGSVTPLADRVSGGARVSTGR